MEKNFIIRVGFYPNGKIIPLGITDNSGNTVYIQKSKEIFSNENGTKYFECMTKKGYLFLKLKNNKWYIDNTK